VSEAASGAESEQGKKPKVRGKKILPSKALYDKGPTATLVQTVAKGKGHLTSVLVFSPSKCVFLSQNSRKMVPETRVRQEGAESRQVTVGDMAVDLAWDMSEMALDLAQIRARKRSGKRRHERNKERGGRKVRLRSFTYYYVFLNIFRGAQREKAWCYFPRSGSPLSGAVIIGQQHLVQTKALNTKRQIAATGILC
jgi:hypothetical protein